MSSSTTAVTEVRFKPRAERRMRYGHPWAYSNEIDMAAVPKDLPPGTLVRIAAADGEALGLAIFNRMPLISARLLSRDPGAQIDADFFADRIERAQRIRARLIAAPYYRLIHAESDGLPGTVIDRFDDTLVVQINTAGMDLLKQPLIEALDRTISPKRLLLRGDSPARQLEGLPEEVEAPRGDIEEILAVEENGANYFADLRRGQKTGWFFDQRENRRFAAQFAKGARVLDAYCYSGGFAIQAALAGAREVVGIDRSEAALALAEAASQANAVGERCRFTKAEVFGELARLADMGERFGLAIVDPPAFVKSKKDLPQGIKGYRKLARLASQLVEKGGYLVAASCSHHVDAPGFTEQLRRGLHDAGRQARILRTAGAGIDHPVHPALPESAYLKAVFLALD